ncbi:TPA: MFS transporter, partial [Neisseria subflava]
MPLQSGGYTFKPHEMPFMPGSPASPEHPKKRRLAYLAIGLLLALSSGFQNGLLTASLPQLRGDLSLDLQQGGWIQAAYFMAYACMSVLFFKVRKAYGLQRFVRITL